MQIENVYSAILKLLSTDGGHIKLNRKLISTIGLEATCVYSELINLQYEAIKKEEWQIIEDNPYFLAPTDKLCLLLGISAHKQRMILQLLQDKKLINIYYGNGNTRMITVLPDYYNLYELLNPTKPVKQALYENIVAHINNIKKILMQNIKPNTKNNLSIFETELLEYLVRESINSNCQFEKEFIKFISTDTIEKELKKEYDRLYS